MEELKSEKRNWKNKGILRKTWERCKSFGNLQTSKKLVVPQTSPTSPLFPTIVKSKSWSTLYPPSPTTPRSPAYKWGGSSKHGACVPHGCFSVYVGPDRQRFVIKLECTKHPRFKKLLEEAELEYGFHCDGPLVLPCDVDSFINVLLEMDGEDHLYRVGCGFSKSRSSYSLLIPPRMVALSQP